MASVAAPLTRLCGSTQPWIWSHLHNISFQQIKDIISAEAILLPLNYDIQEPIYLVTDASANGIGAWIGQGPSMYDIRPAAFYSRKFNRAELNYSVTDKEVLAIIEGLEHFEPQLIGTKFTILTDHKAALAFPKSKDISQRHIRWKTKMSGFDYEIKYLEGRKNILADTLSRYYKNPQCLPPIIRKPQTSTTQTSTPKNVTFRLQSPQSFFNSSSYQNMQPSYAQVASAAVTTRSQEASPPPQTQSKKWINKPPMSAIDPEEEYISNPWESESSLSDNSHVNCAYNP